VTIRTTCPYCGVGCGILATRQADGQVKITGDPEHPANFGRLCSKGLTLGETIGLEQRQLYPLIDGERAGWDEAIAKVAEGFRETIAAHGSESVAFYVSGQLLTEDYYVANKLMKGFIGTANIDTNSRLCMASAVAGHKRAFGADIVPCSYSDLEAADLIVLVGSNLAWCHPVLFQRIQAERQKRPLKLVVIDPRRTATAEEADLHLALKPGSDVALFNGLLADLYRRGEIDARFVFARTNGLGEALVAANAWNPQKVAEVTGLTLSEINAFYELFARHGKTVTCFSMGVNQSTAGTDKVNAIINCHLLTGRIGKAGAGPFSLTGQPNAMGGREVGGLATMLAAHMEFDNSEHRAAVQSYWKSPRMAEKPGLTAVDLFRAVADGRIKAIWIMSTNPAVSMPDAATVTAALKKCPLVVVSDITMNTETSKLGHVFLPAAAWGEKNGTATNSERRISRQRPFLDMPGEARPDWQIICDVAKAMGFVGFEYSSSAEIFREHAGLTGVANKGTRPLDLSEYEDISDADYDALTPFQWGGSHPHKALSFQTADGKARFVATPYRTPVLAVAHGQFRLNTGRVRDQWHTMTRTGLSPRLMQHRGEPHVEINPRDADGLGISAGDLVQVTNKRDAMIARALITSQVAMGDIFMPMHWSNTFASVARINAAIEGHTDPVSRQPELKAGAVSLARYEAAWHGFGLSVQRPQLATGYWSLQPISNGYAFECADTASINDISSFARRLLGVGDEDAVASVFSSDGGFARFALVRERRLAGAFFMSREPVSAARNWLGAQLGAEAEPLQLLRGRPGSAAEDKGATVCACMGVGRNEIWSHAARHPSLSLNAICEGTGAGTGCGSCRPEIVRIINEASQRLQAAE
jgi:assimilatory nitrate reductase catalytic subunit